MVSQYDKVNGQEGSDERRNQPRETTFLASSYFPLLSIVMYKRFAKELKKTKEESSSESEDFEPQGDELSGTLAADREGDSSDHSGDGRGSENDDIEEVNDVLETGILTIDELEAGDEAVQRKPKRGEVLLYQCSICPEKELLSLRDVKEHIASKVR